MFGPLSLAPGDSPRLMRIAYACPTCDAPNDHEVSPQTRSLTCSACGQAIELPAGAIDEGGIHRCLVCPSTDLFVRKDFPQRLGVTIVTFGLLASCVAWAYSRLILTFAILFASGFVDLLLYVIVPNALMCYRCGAIYRGAPNQEQHTGFDLETHERYRQQKIRLAAAEKLGSRQ